MQGKGGANHSAHHGVQYFSYLSGTGEMAESFDLIGINRNNKQVDCWDLFFYRNILKVVLCRKELSAFSELGGSIETTLTTLVFKRRNIG